MEVKVSYLSLATPLIVALWMDYMFILLVLRDPDDPSIASMSNPVAVLALIFAFIFIAFALGLCFSCLTERFHFERAYREIKWRLWTS